MSIFRVHFYLLSRFSKINEICLFVNFYLFNDVLYIQITNYERKNTTILYLFLIIVIW